MGWRGKRLSVPRLFRILSNIIHEKGEFPNESSNYRPFKAVPKQCRLQKSRGLRLGYLGCRRHCPVSCRTVVQDVNNILGLSLLSNGCFKICPWQLFHNIFPSNSMEASIEHNLPSIFFFDKTWTKETINFNESGFIRLLAPTPINLHPLPSTCTQPSSPLSLIYCHHIGSI